jgi:hypothetical protein
MKRALAAVAIVVAVAGCGKRPDAACSRVPDISTFTLNSGETGEVAARARAERCLHHEAYRLAPGEGENEPVALGVMGACLAQIQVAQASAYMSGTTPVAPPVGYILSEQPPEAPPCTNGQAKCNPWERAWNKPDNAAEINRVKSELSDRVYDDMRLIALFRVAEARALRCK